jgi:TolB-like protein
MQGSNPPPRFSARSEVARAPARTVSGRRVLAMIAAMLVLAMIGWWAYVQSHTPPRAIRSLAVLPLDNLSGDPEQEYFTDGMTEALIAELGRLRELRVISRTSVMQYKGMHEQVQESAADLNVDAVLEGSVLRAGDRVRITAQLIDARRDRQLWSESYERDLHDILALQSEVARAVAGEIQIELTPQQNARLARASGIDPRAYDAYLKGAHFQQGLTPSDHRRAVKYLEESVHLDPSYAPAWAKLAAGYT